MARRTATKKTYHHGDLRARLVELGLVELEAHGVMGLSLRALADRAGVSPTAPYRHFADKNALLGALTSEGFRAFADALEAGRNVEAPGRIPRLYAIYVDFALGRPHLFKLMFSSLTTQVLRSEDCNREGDRALDQLRQAVKQEWPALSSDAVLLEAKVSGIWAYIHGIAHLVLDGFLPLEAWKGAFGEGLRAKIP